MEAKIEAAVARTEEDIMSCPLLQKALKKVEEEAVKVNLLAISHKLKINQKQINEISLLKNLWKLE